MAAAMVVMAAAVEAVVVGTRRKLRNRPSGRWAGPASCARFLAVIALWSTAVFFPVVVVAEDVEFQCLEGSGKTAITACDRALQVAPESLALLLALGEHLEKDQQYGEAVVVFKQAVNLYPQNKRAQHLLQETESLIQEQNWLNRRQASAAKPGHPKGADTQTKLERIRCLRLRSTKGLESCNAALLQFPKDAELHFAKGNTLFEHNRLPEAREAYDLAVQLDPHNIEYSRKLAAVDEKLPADKTPAHSAAPPSQQKTKAARPTSSPPPQDKVVARMTLLKTLRDKGLITEEEYQQRKKNLLDDSLALASAAPRGAETKPAAVPSSIAFGSYYALIIGIQNYQHLPKLQTTKRDADVVAQVLAQNYGFTVEKLMDATRRDILLSLSKFRRTLSAEDNLLIYYAGHGWLDKEADSGYWLPVDSVTDNDVDWLSLSTLTSSVGALPAKHVMVVADSCFSGKLTRGVHLKVKSTNYLERIAAKRARVVITSGGLEPVLDSGGAGGHSVFAAAFLKALRENQSVMDGATLFTQIRRPVMLKASQTPEYADIRKAGHDGGDFIFVRKNSKN